MNRERRSQSSSRVDEGFAIRVKRPKEMLTKCCIKVEAFLVSGTVGIAGGQRLAYRIDDEVVAVP